MDLGELCGALASPFPSERTRRAAAEFLGRADASAAFEEIFPFLTWQRSLLATLHHLESAGADLARLTIDPATLTGTFAGGLQPVWGVDGDDPISALRLKAVLERHKQLLGDGVVRLADSGVDRFSLLSGRAFEARYPAYATRMEFDTDVIAPDVAGAIDVVAALTEDGYAFVNLHIRRLDPPDADCKARKEIGRHLITVGVVAGPYFGYERSMYATSERVELRGRRVAAVRPEHLLVMVAARVRHKATFALSSFSDAAVILDAEGATIDWEAVGEAAAAHRLVPHLRVILQRAETVLGRPAVPGDAWRELGGAQQNRLDRLGGRVADADTDPHPGRRSATQRREALQWRWHGTSARRGGLRRLAAVATARLQRSVLYRQQRHADSPSSVDELLARVRTRTGTLCELAPHLAAPNGCVGNGPTWRGPEATVAALTDLAVGIPPQSGPHDCMRWRFDLATVAD